jgi:hypothetical protein
MTESDHATTPFGEAEINEHPQRSFAKWMRCNHHPRNIGIALWLMGTG